MRLVFGWLKSNKCECKNTNGIEPLPTVVPQQICNPPRCVQRRDCWSLQFNVCLWLHDQCPRRISVDVLVALLGGQGVLLCLPTSHLLPGTQLLLARERGRWVSMAPTRSPHILKTSLEWLPTSFYTPVAGCPCLCGEGGSFCVHLHAIMNSWEGPGWKDGKKKKKKKTHILTKEVQQLSFEDVWHQRHFTRTVLSQVDLQVLPARGRLGRRAVCGALVRPTACTDSSRMATPPSTQNNVTRLTSRVVQT